MVDPLLTGGTSRIDAKSGAGVCPKVQLSGHHRGSKVDPPLSTVTPEIQEEPIRVVDPLLTGGTSRIDSKSGAGMCSKMSPSGHHLRPKVGPPLSTVTPESPEETS